MKTYDFVSVNKIGEGHLDDNSDGQGYWVPRHEAEAEIARARAEERERIVRELEYALGHYNHTGIQYTVQCIKENKSCPSHDPPEPKPLSHSFDPDSFHDLVDAVNELRRKA